MTQSTYNINKPYIDDILSMYNILLSTDFGIWTWEPNTDVLYFNSRYMNMLGYTHNAFPFHISTWKKLIHPEDYEKTVLMQEKLLLTPEMGDTFESRFRFLSASGEYVWILGKGFVLGRNEKGQALRVCGMHIDLKSLINTMDEVAIEHDRMSFALEAARDGIWDWNTETNQVYFSPRYIAMLGYTPEEFPPELASWSKRVHPEDLDVTLHKQLAHINDPNLGDIFECVYRFMAANGSYKWILGRGKITKRNPNNGKGTRVVGLHTDITELRATQETLARHLNLDTLTNLHSRFFLDAELSHLEHEDLPLSIIFADIDGLKMLNDNMGHAAGDNVLTTAATLIRHCVGRNTVVARIGGDEIVILLRACPKETASTILDRIKARLDAHNENAKNIPIFISFGMFSTKVKIPPNHMLAMADQDMLMHKEKQRHGNHQALRLWIEKQLGRKISAADVRLAC